MKATLVVSIILATSLASIGGIYYYTMHNTYLTSLVIADDRIIASDGLGPYRDDIDGVFYGRDVLLYTRDEEGYTGMLGLNGSSRSVKVKFTQALWKDANLRDVPSRMPSKNYRLRLRASRSSEDE